MNESVLDRVQASGRSTRGGAGSATPVTDVACRRFTLLDAMLLTAATAVGLSVSRFLEPDLHPVDLLRDIRSLAGFLAPILACWVVAWFVIRFRGPRPRFRRLVRQPGMVGCLAAAGVLAIRWGHEPFVMLLTGRTLGFFMSEKGWPAHYFVGPAVLAAWMTLALGGRTRPARGWIDRLGWSIGWTWVALLLMTIAQIVQAEWRTLHPTPRRPRAVVSRVVPKSGPNAAPKPGIVVQPKGAGSTP